jgi:DNA-binding NarL/FixJ family response regulator
MGSVVREKRKKARILIVEDHPLVRERLREVIEREPDLAVCGEAEDHQTALKLVEATHPDLVLLDLVLKRSHGLDLIKDLRVSHPQLAILVLSMHDEALYAERVIRAGARGYIAKHEATKTVLKAIRTVLDGNLFLSEARIAALTEKISGHPRSQVGFALDALTDRELRVLQLLGQGLTTRKIAAQLRLDLRTVETYRARIKHKLRLQSAYELLQHAIRWVESGTIPKDRGD